jgi:hypothetical protein
VANRRRTLLGALAPVSPGPRNRQRLLLLQPAEAGQREFLHAKFEHVVAPGEGVHLLSGELLLEVLGSDRRADLFIGGTVAFDSVVLIRGDLSPLVVPKTWFASPSRKSRPDFEDFEVIDGGQTVRLGGFEAAADAILYELDPDFRKRERKRRLADDRSFGASLRRLRLQKGLSQRDFEPDLSPKEVARIERGQVKKPHGNTLQALAKRLDVAVGDLGSF